LRLVSFDASEVISEAEIVKLYLFGRKSPFFKTQCHTLSQVRKIMLKTQRISTKWRPSLHNQFVLSFRLSFLTVRLFAGCAILIFSIQFYAYYGLLIS